MSQILSAEDQAFMEACDEKQNYDSFEDYKRDIIRWLMLSGWHYSKESAEELVADEEEYIIKSFEKNDTISDIAVDIGYCCG